MVSINGAFAIDIHGQVVADAIAGDQFSGIGGAEDFVGGAGLDLSDRSLLCEALVAIAHPLFRDDLLAAAARAAKGRSPVL